MEQSDAMMRVASIQVGKVVTEGDPRARGITQKRWTSAFDKRPVDGAVALGSLGMEGDQVADPVHHGGVDKAILCYAVTHYAHWKTEHPDLAMRPGGMGENLTIEGQDETTVCVGDRYKVGPCEFQVSQPRQPCWKIARRWGVKSLTREVAQTGRTGWYVRVIQGGKISTGDPIELRERPHPTWSIARANDILLGREVGAEAVIELMNLAELAQAYKDSIG